MKVGGCLGLRFAKAGQEFSGEGPGPVTEGLKPNSSALFDAMDWFSSLLELVVELQWNYSAPREWLHL
jgi:hypothetical protein